MSIFTKSDNRTEEQNKQSVMSKDEQKMARKISDYKTKAESARTAEVISPSCNSVSIEDVWEDEYRMMAGDHWGTSFAYRTITARKNHPNSVDNFVFAAIHNMKANVCASTPDILIEPVETDTTDGDDDVNVANKLTHICRFNDVRNKFKPTWKKIVEQYLAYGPAIAHVVWDNDWMGGYGEKRWIGDVRIEYINRKDIFFDPAILDLEERLQDCEFIYLRRRKKLSYFKDRWGKKGRAVSEETNTDSLQDEGNEPNQANLLMCYTRGKPAYMPSKRRGELLELADIQESENVTIGEKDMGVNTYKAQEYRDMADGNIDGVHLAYYANDVLLEYIPYIYDHGQYPIAFRLLYQDENNPYGSGEIRQIMIPQILHNKVDEIVVEGMAWEALGGALYNAGAINKRQLDNLNKNKNVGGTYSEVTNVNLIKPREGARIPAAYENYLERKQRHVETISQNTPIQQGISPGADVPFSTIAELGARTDIRTKDKVETLEDFLIDVNKLRIALIAQFYTEDRYYTIKGSGGNTISGKFNANEMLHSWEREPLTPEILAEDGETVLQEAEPEKFEFFVPEFDITIKIVDEKPTDRNYYTTSAISLYQMNAIDLESLWYTLEEGKFPPATEIIDRLKQQQASLNPAGSADQLPPPLNQGVDDSIAPNLEMV